MTADFKQGANLLGKLLASVQVQPQWSVTFTGVPTGGTFTLMVTNAAGTQSATITYTTSLTPAAVKAALEALSNVGAGNATVTGSNGGPYTVTFATVGTTMAASAYALTGGTSPTAAVTSGAVTTTMYTVPASSATKVATFTIHNPSAVLGNVTISVIPSGGSVDGTQQVLTKFPLAGYDTAHVSQCEGDMWDTGTFVSITVDAAPCNVKLTGAVSS